MDKYLFRLNVLFTIADFLICGLGLAMFAWAALFFGRWWLTLFGVIPLAFYSNHGIIVESDLKGGEEDQQKL